jgi:hypothetical protein
MATAAVPPAAPHPLTDQPMINGSTLRLLAKSLPATVD